MLSISPFSGASAAAYFEHDLVSKDRGDELVFDYMDSGLGAKTYSGGGATALDLEGKQVTRGVFRKLLKGIAPNGRAKLRQNAGDARDAAWDLTFSDEKSVAALWALGDWPVRNVVQRCRERALRAVLGHIEEDYIFSRVGKGGHSLIKALPVFAVFDHAATRENDIGTHFHVLVLNAALGADSQWRALDSRHLFRAKMTLGALYRAELAHQLRRYAVRLTSHRGDSFRCADVPLEVEHEFSRASRRIRKVCERLGLTSPAAKERANLWTRPEKRAASMDDLFLEWRKRAAKYGFAAQEAEDCFGVVAGISSRHSSRVAKRAVRRAVAECIHDGGQFKHSAVILRAARQCQTGGAGLGKIVASAEKWLSSDPRIVELGNELGQTVYSTKANVRREEEFFARIDAKREDVSRTVKPKLVRETATRFGLSRDQAAALEHVATRPGAVHCLTGRAGTGKTRTLDALRELCENNGGRVLGFAPTGRAARELEQGARIPSLTLAKARTVLEDVSSRIKYNLTTGLRNAFAPDTLLKRGVRNQRRPLMRRPPKFEGGSLLERMRWNLTTGLRYQLSPDTLLACGVRNVNGLFGPPREPALVFKSVDTIVVDEAAMSSLADLDAVMRPALKAGARVVLVGDKKQLGAVENASPFAELVSRLGAATLTQLWRHEKSWLRDVNSRLHNGDAEGTLRAFAEQGKLHLSPPNESPFDALCSSWLNKRTQSVRDSLIVAATNAQVAALNAWVQTARRKAGELGQGGSRVGEGALYAGDRVVLRRNDDELRVANGDFGTVQLVLGQKVIVTLDRRSMAGQPISVSVDLRRNRSIELGYAVTAYRAQGASVKQTFVLASDPFTLDAEAAYVALTRSSHDCHLFASELTAGRELSNLVRALKRQTRKKLAVEERRELALHDNTVERSAINGPTHQRLS